MAEKAPKPPSRKRRRQQPFHRCILPSCQMLLALASPPAAANLARPSVRASEGLRSGPFQTASCLPIGCAPLIGHYHITAISRWVAIGIVTDRLVLCCMHCASAPGGRVCRTRDGTNDWKRREAVCVHVHVRVHASARACNFRACRASAHCATRFPQQKSESERLIPHGVQ